MLFEYKEARKPEEGGGLAEVAESCKGEEKRTDLPTPLGAEALRCASAKQIYVVE